MAITQARTAALRFILAPSVGLKQAGKGMLGLIIAPDHLVSKVRERGRHDMVDGVIAAAGTGATYIGLASLATMAVGAVVAVATHGESVALITTSRRLANIGGIVGTTTLVGSLLKNQVDLARAKTDADFRKQTNELANNYASYAFSPAVTIGGGGDSPASAAFDAAATTAANQVLGRAVSSDKNPDYTQSVRHLVTLADRITPPADGAH